jgi:hypothetical protein
MRAGLLIFVLMCLLCARPTVAEQATETLREGLVLQHLQIAPNKKIHIARISLRHFDVRVLSPLVSLGTDTTQRPINNPERAARGYYLQEYLLRFGAELVSSGGYIESYSPPTSLGFVKSAGRTVSQAHNSWLTEAIFCSDEGKAIIDLMKFDLGRPDYRDCVQAGPLLLRQGRIPTDLPSRKSSGYSKLASSVQEQTFLCLDPAQNLLIGISDRIDLPTLTTLLLRKDVNCWDAIRLTGQDTAGLRTRSLLFGDDDYLFPNAIGVIRRSN